MTADLELRDFELQRINACRMVEAYVGSACRRLTELLLMENFYWRGNGENTTSCLKGRTIKNRFITLLSVLNHTVLRYSQSFGELGIGSKYEAAIATNAKLESVLKTLSTVVV